MNFNWGPVRFWFSCTTWDGNRNFMGYLGCNIVKRKNRDKTDNTLRVTITDSGQVRHTQRWTFRESVNTSGNVFDNPKIPLRIQKANLSG